MKSKLNLIGMIVGAAVLLAGLLVLMAMTREADPGLRARVSEQLRDIKQLDAELNLHVLRSKDDLNRNYDVLAGLLQSLGDAEVSLDDLVRRTDSDSVTVPASALKQALDAKAEIVESFKTQNSVVRNSMRFLPLAALQLEDMLSGEKAPASELSAIRDATGRLLANILHFSQVADGESERQVQDALERLEALRSGRAGPVFDQMGLLVSHGRAILVQNAKLQTLLVQIVEVKTAPRTDELWTAFESAFEAAAATRDQWRLGLSLYSALLLALLIFMAAKLIQSYRDLNAANTLLIKANETLEARVKERTEGLAQALERLKESQLQLIQAGKMASLGQMVAGIAHEINTPLAYISNSLQVAYGRMDDINILLAESVAAMRLASTDDTPEETLRTQFAKLSEIASAFVETDAIGELETLIEDGLHGIEHISEIVANLKDFSRLDRSKVDEFDVNDGVRSTVKIARHIVKKHDLKLLLGDAPKIRCSPSQVNQVLLNLVTNACQACPDSGGRLSIITRPHKAGVLIEVVDNGAGIPADIQDKIFDPFFTTKKVGQGTGLGLAIVYKIVVEHGGQVWFTSRVGVGTKFSVYLPRTASVPGEDAT